MKKITSHLWFDKEAKEATEFYVSVFPNSKIINHTVITDTPSGDCDVLTFELMGTSFQSISAGPYFKFNPSISFMVNFDPSQDDEAEERINEIWNKLSDGGKVLMPIQEYSFSKRYGWIEDKYGLSWQLILTNPNGEERPFIMPSLLYTDASYGKAEEASEFYLSVFKDSKRGALVKYDAGMEPNMEGTVMFSDFRILDRWFVAMDGGLKHGFAFSEAISFVVSCENQEEIDYYWDKLSAVPEAEQCGWLKDKYGLSWQIVPSMMEEVMTSGDKEKIDKLTQTFLKMKKFDIAMLEDSIKN